MQGLKISIGRDTKSDWVIEPEYSGVSSNHLTITEQIDDSTHQTVCYLLEDHSTNGTYINTQFVHNGTYYVKQGDHITLGRQYELNWEKMMRFFATSKTQKKTDPLPAQNLLNEKKVKDSQETKPVQQFDSPDPIYDSPQPQNIISREETNGPQELHSTQPQRHGFVTFWLWLGIIGSAISIPFSIITYQSMSNLGYMGMQLINAGIDITPFSDTIVPHILILQIAATISGICMIVFYSRLLKWQKSAFWGLLITAVTVAVINIILMSLIQSDYELIGLTYSFNPTLQLIAPPLSMLILWAILQIKKDGISCWKQLN